MGDRVSKEKRSQVMSRVRARGTKPEKAFAQILTARGLTTFVEQPAGIKGRPDFVFAQEKVAIFVDSCFWHGCPAHLRMPASNADYWQQKIARNKRRDNAVRKELKSEGWLVVRVWEHELPDSPSLKKKLTQLQNLLAKNTKQPRKRHPKG